MGAGGLEVGTPTPILQALRKLEFELPFPTPTRNVMDRMHPGARKRERARMAGLIKLQLVGKLPAEPFSYARVTIRRHAKGLPDHDGLIGGLKDLLDVLQPPGKPRFAAGRRKPVVLHPNGLAIIEDDSTRRMVLDAASVRIAGADSITKTTVMIEELTQEMHRCLTAS